MENFRRAIGLRIKETKEVYEGEVTELTPVETENPMGGVLNLLVSQTISYWNILVFCGLLFAMWTVTSTLIAAGFIYMHEKWKLEIRFCI